METAGTGRRVTIDDVARRAGVSKAAVSKVMRNAYGVSDDMESRVRTAMADLGYRPSVAARSLRGRSFTIGLLLDNIRNPFYGDILEGITDALSDTEYQVLIGSAGFLPEPQSRLADAMIDRAMDGLILVAPAMSKAQVMITSASVPTVVVGHHDTAPQYDSVFDDDLAGAALVVEHLVGLGHRRIAHTSASANGNWLRRPEQVRSDGYRIAMAGHGLQEEVQIVSTSYSEEGGYRAGLELLGRPNRPTAIFAGADIAAMGVLRAAAELKLRVPRDLSLVGYDNSTVASLARIDLTTVDQAGHDMGASAARLLQERIGGRARPVLTSASPKLVVRRTTAKPRT